MYQGRQYHQWFGHGTKPQADPTPDSLDARVRTLGMTAIASLPPGKRSHPAATFDDAASGQLVAAVRAWVRALDEPASWFAKSLLGSSGGHAAVEHLRHAADLVAEGGDPATMREASDALAAGMQAVGLDRWRAKLRDYAERAQSGASEVGAGSPYRYQLRTAEPRIQTVAIDFDPRNVPLTPDAEDIDNLLRLTGQVVLAEANVEALRLPAAPRGSVLHKRFADEVTRLNLPGVRVEQSFDRGGTSTQYGTRGSVRTDVIFTNPKTGRIEGIWDWKVGGTELGRRRAQVLSERVSGVAGKPELPPYPIPVRELHVDPVLREVPDAG